MPSATPNSRIVEFAELAIAKSLSGRPSSTIDAPGAKTSPMPTPAMTSGTRKAEYDDPFSVMTANQTSEAVCSTRPVNSSAR